MTITLRAARAALACALLAGTALPLFVATPAAAQQAVAQPDHPAWVLRLLNDHRTETGALWRAWLQDRPGRIAVEYVNDQGRWAGDLQLAGDRRVLEGALLKSGKPNLVMRVRPGVDGERFTIEILDEALKPKSSTALVKTTEFATYATETKAIERNFADWIGDWQVNGRTLKIRAEGKLLTGTLYGQTGGGRTIPELHVVFRGSPYLNAPLTGAWQRGGFDSYPHDGGSLIVEMAANKLGFAGDLFDRGSTNAWRGMKIATATAQKPVAEQGPAPALDQQQYAPWVGAWALNTNDQADRTSYLEFRWADRTLTALLWRKADGKLDDVGTFAVDSRASTPTRLVGTVTHDSGATQPLEFVLSADRSFAKLVASGAGEKQGGYMRRVAKPGDAVAAPTPQALAAAMAGKWETPFGDLTIAPKGGQVSGVVTRPGGTKVFHSIEADEAFRSEVQRWYVGRQDFENEFNIVLAPDGKSFQAYTQGGRGKLANAQYWEGSKAGTASAPASAPPTDTAQPSTPPSSPVAQPSPAVPASTEATATALAQAGVFHRLEDFDVRLDEARAGRDGRLHVFLTVRNKGRDFYMSSGPFWLVATDADGVGVQASGSPYRADGEEATSFANFPTIPAGGEFRMRYVLALPDVHAPLARLSVRESPKKALFFDVAHADPDPSPAPAPAAGRGAFKALSKFDVRIDNVVPARDGKLEAYLTLRNASRQVQSTSKGHIKLIAANSDGAKVTSVSSLHSIRGERAGYEELPVLIYAEPGAEMRLRFLFDEGITGPITISDGTVSQTFTAGG